MVPNGKVNFGVYNAKQFIAQSPKTYNDGAWHHVVASMDSTGMKLYLDGELVATNANNIGKTYAGYWRVGGDTTWYGRGWFNGLIDEAAVYPEALPAKRVLAHYQASDAAATQPPTAAFTPTVTERTLAVDATASTAAATITKYAWDFGDGSTAEGATATHEYAADGRYLVKLTVTDKWNESTTLKQNVSVANAAPEAVFEPEVDGLALKLDASASSDDGGIASYQWDFGDGTTGSGKTASHTYATAGTYPVTLTITDARGLTDSVTKSFVMQVNEAPVAAFTHSSNGLEVSVDASGSSDSDGSISTYQWDFGDGSTGEGRTASHSYSKPGTYSVKLTVTDNLSSKASTTDSVEVTLPVGTVIAADSFARTVARGWGDADNGGTWSVSSAARFSVDGSKAVVTIPTAGNGPSARLDQVSARDVSITTDFALDQVPAGGAYYQQVLARVSGTSTYYMLSTRVNADGGLRLQLSSVVAGTETALKTTTLPSFGYTAGERLKLRLDVSGTDSTKLEGKVWRASDSEPTSAQVSTTDATSELQQAGAVGLKAYGNSALTNTPLATTVSSFKVAQA